jgi:hypothetical protein
MAGKKQFMQIKRESWNYVIYTHVVFKLSENVVKEKLGDNSGKATHSPFFLYS